MNNKEKLAAADAHIAVTRDRANRSPEALALDLIHEVVSDLEAKSREAKAPKAAPAPKAPKAK